MTPGYGYALAAMLLLGFVDLVYRRGAAAGVRECGAVFRRAGGCLVIDVTFADGGERRLTRPLPSPD